MSTTFLPCYLPAYLPGAGSLLAWGLESGRPAQVSAVRHQVMAVLRRIVTDRAGRWDPGAADRDAVELGDIELVVAELLNNVLAHTPGTAWVELGWDGPGPVLTVSDSGPGFDPVPRLPDDQLAERGRGLYLIDRLADDLVVNPRPGGGSAVRVRLRLGRLPSGDGRLLAEG